MGALDSGLEPKVGGKLRIDRGLLCDPSRGDSLKGAFGRANVLMTVLISTVA